MWQVGVKAAAKDPSVQGGGSNQQPQGGGVKGTASVFGDGCSVQV